MKKSNVPQKVGEVLREIGMTPQTAGWDCHGTFVLLHKALEKVAAHRNIKFDPPQIVEADVSQKQCVMIVTGHMGDVSEWSIGEAAPYNNKNSYPFAMAEKRAKDRVILKLVGLHGDVYSEEEADDFKASKPAQMDKPMELDFQARFDATLQFYENCTAAAFEKFEPKYQKFLDSKEMTEEQFDLLTAAHSKRKTELKI